MSSNRPFVSRYLRKENYQSLNQPSPRAFSPLTNSSQQQDLSAGKRHLQQKHIEELQEKVNMILLHNEQLSAENERRGIENNELRRRLAELEAYGMANQKVSRYQLEDGEYAVRKAKSELMIKVRECEVLTAENFSLKQAGKKESEALKLIISNLSLSNEQLKAQSSKITSQLRSISQDFESKTRLILREQERKLLQEISRVSKQKQQQLARQRQQQNHQIEQLSRKFQEERGEWTARKNSLVSKLQDNHNKQINDLRQQMAAQFHHELSKLQEQATERCKNERDKAEQFIKDSLAHLEGQSFEENQSLRRQIRALQISLENRKNLIKEITSRQENRQNTNEYDSFSENLLLRQRLKEQVQCLLRENEQLKVATAQKYQRDLRQMVRIYDDKLQILSTQIRTLWSQNQELRNSYERQVEGRIRQRRAWQVEAGQLRNLIRKLKVQLHGIQEEFKLNIDGIRDQNATFSMTLMKSAIQDRDKASFFEDQNRKLRTLYEKHQAEVDVERRQAQEKVLFYQSQNEQLRHSIQRQKDELSEKEAALQAQISARQQSMRNKIKAERQQLEAIKNEFENGRQEMQRQLFETREKMLENERQLKQANQDIDNLTSKLKENEAHIQRLRMELELAGTDENDDRDGSRNDWHYHYEGIIHKLQTDKDTLQDRYNSQQLTVEHLVQKYKNLEKEMKKASYLLDKRSSLDAKVIELGLDNNLVKNMAEVWKSQRLE